MSKNAQTSSSQSTSRQTIGYLTAILNPYQIKMLSGAIQAAQEHDSNLLCFVGDQLHDPTFRAQANVLYDLVGPENVAGIVFNSTGMHNYVCREEMLAFIQRYHALPKTNIGAIQGITSISVEWESGVRELMTHLIEMHHYRRIAIIRGAAGHHDDEGRFRAYVDALAEHHIPFDPKLVSPHYAWQDDWQNSSRAAIQVFFDERRLQPKVDVEVIIGNNDASAISAMETLRERGIRVPDDIAIVGFDDHDICQCVTPALTSVHQPIAEQAQWATDTLLSYLDGGPASESMIASATLVVRQSCGCINPVVARAAAGPVKAERTTLAAVLSAHREDIVTEMRASLGASDSASVAAWVELLLNGFVGDMHGEQPGYFLHAVDTVLRQIRASGENVGGVQQGLSVLRCRVAPVLVEQDLALAENLWHQARIMIGQVAEQAKAFQGLQVEQREQALRQLDQRLITTFHVEELMNILAEELPLLGIPSCYLALYEDPTSPMEWSRLRMGYTEQGRIPVGDNAWRFPSHQLVPEGLWPQGRRYTYVVEPLYFQETQLGFILFEVGPPEGGIYDVLRGDISSSLQGALLVQRVQERSAEIVRQKYILDTFMANVPDRIYFKDRESRFMHANSALMALFGIDHLDQLIGKTDFDFFPEEQARPKYEQEQAIMRTEQPLLEVEEPDGIGRWALTTKMPLRDEHGAIIGTFGISRDITELKNAQQALQQAYSEISALNTQLQEENVRMGAELSVVKQLQQMILPRPQELAMIPGLDIVGYMQPADEVGGDYYDVLAGHGIIHIGIGDVTGHGLESGVLMLMTQAAIRTLIEHGETDPVKFVNTLNRLIYKNIERIGADKNLTFALVQYQQGHLKLVGQHEELLVVRQGGRIERVNTMNLGFPVGLEPEIGQWVKAVTITLQAREGIVLYTDGIPEAENPAEEQYGMDRLCAVISQHWNQSAEAIKQAVVADVVAFIGTQKIYDDLTLVVLKQQ